MTASKRPRQKSSPSNAAKPDKRQQRQAETAQRVSKAERAAAARQAKLAEADPVPTNIDDFRLEMTRRFISFAGTPLRCRNRVCRRSKRCLGKDFACSTDFPPKPSTPAQDARMRDAMLRKIKRQLGEV